MFESLQSFLELGLGFALAGVLATGYQALTEQPPSFKLIGGGPSLRAFAALFFLVFAAPFIIMRNILRRPREESRRFEFVMLGTMLAGFWSLMSGTVLVMALRALGNLSL